MKTLVKDPIKYAGGYTLDLYCKYTVDYNHDSKNHGVSFYGDSKQDAFRQARALGWVIHNDRTTTCPECSNGSSSKRT